MIVGVGEAMVEFAPRDGGYARGFAGDTLNTVWHFAQLGFPVRYCTRIGRDKLSQDFLAFLSQAGIGAEAVGQEGDRTMGLYLVELDGAERSFVYWRDAAAARRLADDPDRLDAAFAGAGLVHVSGITLAVIGEGGRANLLAALARARAAGAKVSFDPNLRRRLWPDDATARAAQIAAYAVTDFALPSFDDEAALWGDASPSETTARLAALGVAEIVVKNGAGPARLHHAQGTSEIAAARVEARDATGAGDAFDAGYLAARLRGLAPDAACGFAHTLAGEVVRWPGALPPREALAPFAARLTPRVPPAA
jgi:2-dehydro-3-deoxygluconokinase